MAFLTGGITKKRALLLLALGGLIPLGLFLLMTWLSVKTYLHLPHADGLYWLVYAVIALPMFAAGLRYWLKNTALLILASLLLLVSWGMLIVMGVFWFHVSIGGTL